MNSVNNPGITPFLANFSFIPVVKGVIIARIDTPGSVVWVELGESEALYQINAWLFSSLRIYPDHLELLLIRSSFESDG